MIQQRPVGEKQWFSPNRDIAYCWQHQIAVVADQLEETKWQEWFADYFKYAGVTEADIGRALAAYVRAIASFTQPGISSPREALEKAGWFDIPKAAQVAVFMKLGQVSTLAFFTAIRDVTIEGEEPQLDDKKLKEALKKTEEMLAYAGAPWWKRGWRWLARTLGRLRGSET